MILERRVITQTEHESSADPNVAIATLLGSCVSCCLWDPLKRLGRANHMLIAHLRGKTATSNELGVNAMELLINDILKLGGARERLVAKVFGGASMVDGLSDIGPANCSFTLDFLARERIKCVSQSLGGRQARHLLFWPATGKARQRFLRGYDNISQLTSQDVPKPSKGNGLELF